MFHPLQGSYVDLSDEELTKKIGDLNGKLSIAWRMGSGSGVVTQMQMLMNGLQEEQGRRNALRLEEMEKNSKNFKNIIEIK
jgi:hypothetical protein